MIESKKRRHSDAQERHNISKKRKMYVEIPRGHWNWLDNHDGSCYSIAILESIVRLDDVMNYSIRNNNVRKLLHKIKFYLSHYINKYYVPEGIDARHFTDPLYKNINYPQFLCKRKFKPDGGSHIQFWKKLQKRLSLKIETYMFQGEWNNRNLKYKSRIPDIFSINILRKNRIKMYKYIELKLHEDNNLQSLMNSLKVYFLNFPKILVIHISPNYVLKHKLYVEETLTIKKKHMMIDEEEMKRYKKNQRYSPMKKFKRTLNIDDGIDKEECEYSLASVILYEYYENYKCGHVATYTKECNNLWRFIDNGSDFDTQRPLDKYNPNYCMNSATLLFFERKE